MSLATVDCLLLSTESDPFALRSVSSSAAVIALIGMGRATAADPVNGWRWVFRTLLIFDAICLIGFGLFYHPPPRTVSHGSLWFKIKSLDWIGYFLLIAGLVPLLMGFAWSSDSTIGWHDPHSYVPVAIGFAFLILCLLYGAFSAGRRGTLQQGLTCFAWLLQSGRERLAASWTTASSRTVATSRSPCS